MTSPDLSRRVDRQGEDLRAISDTVLDIKETVDEQSVTLVEHGRDLAEIKSTLAGHSQQLAEILTLLRANGSGNTP